MWIKKPPFTSEILGGCDKTLQQQKIDLKD